MPQKFMICIIFGLICSTFSTAFNDTQQSDFKLLQVMKHFRTKRKVGVNFDVGPSINVNELFKGSCCYGNFFTNRCGDGTYGNPYCGRGQCNMFGCNCDGGCRMDVNWNQQWIWRPVHLGYYQLVNTRSQKCLDVDASRINENGAKLQQWDCLPGNDNQKWQWIDKGDYGFQIVNKQRTKVLHEILTESENMAYLMQVHLYEGNKSCGVKVERVEIKDVRLSVTMQRSMAAEAKG
ncbi:unnamed protein product [Rotaria sp. Silwood1]|nr:unnamed protein product [Rotaria sp. Silwood1]